MVTFGVHTGPQDISLDELRAASELAREALPPDVVHLLPPDADAGGWGGVILARSASGRAARGCT